MSNECPICNDLYSEARKPKVAPCGHSICADCVGQLLAHQQADCPICKARVDWRYVPDNYALLNAPSGEEALRELARNQASEEFAKLNQIETELKMKISQLRSDDEKIKKEKMALIARPRPAYNIRAVAEPIRVIVERSIEELEIVHEEWIVNDRDGERLIEIRKTITSYKRIYERIVIVAEDKLQIPQVDYPEESKEDPLALKIRMLQKESNDRMLEKQRYCKAIAEIESLTKEMIGEKLKAEQLCEEHRKNLRERSEAATNGLSNITRQMESAEALRTQLRADIEDLRIEEKQMIIEKQQALLSLEHDAQERLLGLVRQMEAINTCSEPFLEARRRKDDETMRILHLYLQFLRDLFLLEQAKIQKVQERISELTKKIEKAYLLGEVIERDQMMITERQQMLLGNLVLDSKKLVAAKDENRKEAKELRKAQKKAVSTETQFKKSVEDNKLMQKRIESIKKDLNRLQGEITLKELKIDNINAKFATILDKQTALDKEYECFSSTYASALRYESDILTPILVKVSSELSTVTSKLEEIESTYRESIAALETEYHRLTIHNVSVTPFVSSPLFTPNSPLKGANNERRQLAALESEKGRLMKECALLEKRLNEQHNEAKRKQFESLTEVSSGPADMKWAFIISLAVAFLFFSLIGR